MEGIAVLAAVAVLVMLFVLAEIAGAVLPLIIVMTLVPPDERDGLARVLAASDSSRKPRLWRALRVAVKERRAALARKDPQRNATPYLNATFDRAPRHDAPINPPRPVDPPPPYRTVRSEPHSPAGQGE
ncbi:hypothetical protein [Mangrovihabitans endophyticus]|uniref:Uncharacterized protein n=1 Tax=Mangrovihabitans endophyticus TaxID=1751298 RepID=A0A8J3BYP2_9ACTN|nr:hypothetical protein [Mangrovihabitans endophyticus]GGK85339.1 hypothetical protein GCM10012284_19480 [Mangrovihabitans endophyticus]